MRRLKALLEKSNENKGPWKIGSFSMRGNIPVHYKRLSCSEEEAVRLARIGASELLAAFGIQLYFTQSLIAGAMLSGDYDTVVVVTPSQYGKLIADDEPVMTSEGWKRHGDLRIGDKVVAPNGEFVDVIYIHPKQVADREVVFQDGTKVKCHHNHEWVVLDRNYKKVRTIPTYRMEERSVLDRHGRAKFVVQPRQPMLGERRDLAVNPYVFGAWLGDGSTTKGQICAHPDDIAVLDKCRKYYPEGSEWTHRDTGVITRSFIGLANDLSEYDLCFQRKDTRRKYIPDIYLTASLEQRLELLAGLIDTDGYQYETDGRFYFTTADETLKNSFEDLIATFGWKTSTIEVQPRMSSSGIQGKHVYWRIGFNPTLDIPCVLERKRPTRFARQKGIGVVEINHINPVPGNCITVKGGVYCVGRKMIPTHNSWLLGHVSPLLAYKHERLTVAAATANTTEIIMAYIRQSIRTAAPDIKKAILGEAMKKIDRLDASVSKLRISFADGGSIDAITLGDSFSDNSAHNKAVGRGGGYIVDEAALCSEDALGEIGRRELSSVDGTKDMLVMISNPHKPGVFYDYLVDEHLDDRTIVIWMDALTATQEGRWSAQHVLDSDFAKREDTRSRYWMCELPRSGVGMFDEVKIAEPSGSGLKFMGIDAAYKGKDNLCLAMCSQGQKVSVDEIMTIKTTPWIDGKTSEDICDTVARVYHQTGCAFVCVDVGFGVWLIEGLLKRGVNCMGINFGAGPTKERVKLRHYAAVNAHNMRAELHLDLQGLIEDQSITFSPQAYSQVKDVMPYIACDRKNNGKVIVRPKIEIKNAIGKSPDELDAVLLAIHALVLYGMYDVAFIA